MPQPLFGEDEEQNPAYDLLQIPFFTGVTVKIPLNPPLTKGEELRSPLFAKGGRGDFIDRVNIVVFMTVALIECPVPTVLD